MNSCFSNTILRKVGSRKRGEFGRDSDLDLQVCIVGSHISKESFYPLLIDCLKKLDMFNGERLRVQLGGSGNVVNVFPERGGKVSLALVDECW